MGILIFSEANLLVAMDYLVVMDYFASIDLEMHSFLRQMTWAKSLLQPLPQMQALAAR